MGRVAVIVSALARVIVFVSKVTLHGVARLMILIVGDSGRGHGGED